jgi:uncharacterized protein
VVFLKLDLLKLIVGEAFPIHWEYDPAELDLHNQDIEFLDKLKFKGEAEKGDGFLLIRGTITSRLKESCSRCLAKADKDYKREIDLNVAIKNDQASYDYTPEVREEVLISYPAKILCSKNCKGLCSNCGANLNVAPCGCYKCEKGESPFSILKKLKEDKE